MRNGNWCLDPLTLGRGSGRYSFGDMTCKSKWRLEGDAPFALSPSVPSWYDSAARNLLARSQALDPALLPSLTSVVLPQPNKEALKMFARLLFHPGRTRILSLTLLLLLASLYILLAITARASHLPANTSSAVSQALIRALQRMRTCPSTLRAPVIPYGQ